MTEIQVPDIDPIQKALAGVPFSFDAPPHVYTVCCPRFEPKPGVKKEQLLHDQLRLYMHVPFCSYKCSFCNFAIRVGANRELMERYIEALGRELDWVEPGTVLSQLFVGGGTPTALPPDLLDRLFELAFSRVDNTDGKVHTCESSPDTLTAEHVEVMLKWGIGRVSMGIQSLDGSVLDGIQRGHTSQQALDKLKMLTETGLVVNADLIYGLPGQTEAGFRQDMIALAESGANAMTLYDLRINEKTTVGRALAEEERLDLGRLLRWRVLIRETAESLGFVQTRWHTYKRKDSVALEHRWLSTFDDVSHGYQMGIGNSARSHLGYTVYRNVRKPETYIQKVMAGESPVESTFPLTEDDRRALYFARSIGDGGALDRDHYEHSFGRSLDEDHGSTLKALREGGLIEDDGNCISLTEVGKLVHDRVTLSLYPNVALDILRERQVRVEDRLQIVAH